MRITPQQRMRPDSFYTISELKVRTVMGKRRNGGSSEEGAKKASILLINLVFANSLIKCGQLAVITSNVNKEDQSQRSMLSLHCFYMKRRLVLIRSFFEEAC